jgi:hypothetical protein
MKQYMNTIIVAISVVIAGYLLASGYQNRAKVGNSISVTGLGEENFTSDLIVWKGNFSRKAMELKDANAALNKDKSTVTAYLKSKGLSSDEIIFQGVNISKDFYYDYDESGRLRNTIFNGYVLTQDLMVSSKKVDLVETISRQVTELIDRGVELNAYQPEYYYTKLAQLKQKMITSATKDAQERAQNIAENAGGSLGKLKNADMGVTQITGENSSEDYSWGGSFNTSSKKKTASITIKLRYEID